MDRWFVMTTWAVHWAKDPEAICGQSITPACAHEQRRSASGRRTSQWMRAATARAEGSEGMQTLLAHGGQTRSVHGNH
jgi:hypothetical protein